MTNHYKYSIHGAVAKRTSRFLSSSRFRVSWSCMKMLTAVCGSAFAVYALALTAPPLPFQANAHEHTLMHNEQAVRARATK